MYTAVFRLMAPSCQSSSSKLNPVRQAHIYVLPVQPHLNLHHQGDPLLLLLHPQHHHVDINTYEEHGLHDILATYLCCDLLGHDISDHHLLNLLHLQSHILPHHVAPLSKRLNSSLYC